MSGCVFEAHSLPFMLKQGIETQTSAFIAERERGEPWRRNYYFFIFFAINYLFQNKERSNNWIYTESGMEDRK